MGLHSHYMSSLPEKLTRAAIRILKPLVRVLLRNGLSHAEFSEIARRVFVEVGFEDFEIDRRKQIVSRVAVLTGLSRKEVLRLKLLEENSPLIAYGSLNRAARVIGVWIRDDEFRDSDGAPLELLLYGDVASFAALVKRYSGDITAGAVFDELLRVGAIEKKDELIKLRTGGYVPQHGKEEKIDIMGVCGADLLNTLEHNLASEGELAHLQRAVVYHRLPDVVAREFEKHSAERVGPLLIELNQWLAEKKGQLEPSTKNNKRIGLGIYYFEETMREEDKK